MRKISYVILLPLAWIGSSFAFNWLSTILLMPIIGFAPNMIFATPISILIGIPGEVVKLLVLYRVFCWIKNRSIFIPDTYSGGYVVIGVITSVFMMIVLGGYGYLIFSKASGISGIPLGFSIGISGLLSTIPVLIAEFRNFYAWLPKQS